MLDITNIYMFILASTILCIAPGPDNIYVMIQGITNSKKAAIVTSLGLCSGIIIHTSAAAFGISVIFQTSEIAFNVVKFAGALYLMYLAYQAFIHRDDPLEINQNQEKNSMKRLYLKGFVMNILNPKVSIFFLAFLPQFVSVQNGNVPLQMILLGAIFMILTIIIFSSIGIFSNILGSKVMEKPSVVKIINRITAGVLFSLGLKLALTQR